MLAEIKFGEILRKSSIFIVGLILLPCILFSDGYQISYFFLTDNVNCKEVETYQKEKYYSSFDSTFDEGIVIRVIDQTSENQLVATSQNSENYFIFEPKELHGKSISITYLIEWKDMLNKLSENEILISFLLDIPSYFRISNRDQIQKLILSTKTILDNYSKRKIMILCTTYNNNSTTSLSTKELSIRQVKMMFQYNYNQIIDVKKNDQDYLLLKTIITDETIPYQISRKYISAFLSSSVYDYKRGNKLSRGEFIDFINKSGFHTKDDFFNFIIEIIKKHSGKNLIGFEYSSQIDQEVVFSILRSFDYNIITSNEFYSLLIRILKIDKNPAVSLLAYSGLVKYYLSRTEFSKAFLVAKDAIIKYNTPITWRYFKGMRYLNVTPAIIFIEHFYSKEHIPENFINYLEQFKTSASSHKELINYFNFCLAREKLFSNYNLDEVIQAYKRINTKPEICYEFYSQLTKNLLQQYIDMRDDKEISEIINNKKFIMKAASDSLRIKEHILSNKESVICFPKDNEIIIHHMNPSFLNEDKKYFWWFKGEINSKIYWIHTGDLY